MSETINISELAEGAVQEQINAELQKVFANIQDPNTVALKARKLTVTLEFKPNENRSQVDVGIQTKLSLQPIIPIRTSIYVEKDLETGDILATEFTRGQLKGQTKFDPDTGEIYENNTKITDLRRAK